LTIKGWAQKWAFRIEIDPAGGASPWWVSLVAIVLAFILSGFLIQLNGSDALRVYAKMFQGAFGSVFGLTETLVKTIPLLLCGLGVAIAYRISVWNIGAEGQFIAGAVGATGIMIYFPHLAPWVGLPLMLLAGILAGGIWGLLTALPKVWFGVNELITSLMLNYVAFLGLQFLVFGPWRDPKGYNFPGSPVFPPAETIPTLGDTRLHWGFFLALAVVFLYAVLVKSTKWGYELRLIGANPKAAQSAGIQIRGHVVLVMFLSGALAGLAGMMEVSGVTHRLSEGVSPGYGYTAIIVAWIAKLNPWGLVLSAFFLAGLIEGGFNVQTLGLPPSLSSMIQGAVLFFLIAGDLVGRLRLRRKNNQEQGA
jgi:simple sugar transport system permease protein